MNLEDLIQRIDQLIKSADEVIQTEAMEEYVTYVDEELFHAFRSASLSFLSMTFGKDHTYYDEFNSRANHSDPSCAQVGRGILSAAREELSGGWLTTTKGLISAEIFSDFIEMAQHLLEEGYKDPAAVMAGSVLEEHLRQLCQKHGIPAEATKKDRPQPKKADALNTELVKKKVYNQLDQKQVTTWLDLRNKAAHGKYPEYTKEHVSQMLQGLSNFMVRIPL